MKEQTTSTCWNAEEHKALTLQARHAQGFYRLAARLAEEAGCGSHAHWLWLLLTVARSS